MGKTRSKFIDCLKALAIIAVLLYHSGFLTYGYLGVDMFLVINGYFVTIGLNKLLITDGLISRGDIFTLKFVV